MDLGNFLNMFSNSSNNNCHKPQDKCDNKGSDLTTIIILFVIFSCFKNNCGSKGNPCCDEVVVPRRRRRREEVYVYEGVGAVSNDGLFSNPIMIILLFFLIQGNNSSTSNTNTVINVDQLSEDEDENNRFIQT